MKLIKEITPGMNAYRTIVFLMTMLLSPGLLGAGENAPRPKGKIVIYYFEDQTRNNRARYYSYIIPDALATQIQGSNKYDVQTIPVTINYVGERESEEVYKNHIRFLSDRGKEFSADYIIVGSYFIEKKRININSQIFNVRDQKIMDIDASSDELGALLFNIIDKITEKINLELDKYYREKFEAPEVSPYLPLYKSLQGVAFGISYGRAGILGSWGDIYKAADMVMVTIDYDLNKIGYFNRFPFLKDCSASVNLDYFSTNTDDKNASQFSYLSVYGLTLNLTYPYRFTPFFSAGVTLGAGAAYSSIYVPFGSGDPFSKPLVEETSVDPLLGASLAVKFLYGPVLITTGIGYRAIFYKDRMMNLALLFFGAGFRL